MELFDLTIVSGVERLMVAIESIEKDAEAVRENRKLRYLSLVKKMSPKKDVYGVMKARRRGMRSIITASLVGNVATRNLLREMSDATHTRPLPAAEDQDGWVLPGSSPVAVLVGSTWFY